MTGRPVPVLDPLSGVSLLIRPTFGDTTLSQATGFTVAIGEKHYLVTNWHVVTGRNADTGKVLSQSAAVPDRLQVVFHSNKGVGQWVLKEVALTEENGAPLWLEHPKGREVDVVMIPIPLAPDASYYPLDLALARADVLVEPAMSVSIIGFPLGLTAHAAWPIWKTGHIASEPEIDFADLPCFLVDATTREGMSGSPVILRFWGGFPKRDGSRVIGGSVTSFLGIYSGRLDAGSEIGRVWRPEVLKEIVGAAGA
ncbi:MAG: trypsin-like peptidase domain-containing protein [Gemmatimonadetes bacterium]|nr:trypsin-like peptidase domain-containing protein [Gemmatimonadota bacterium]